MSIPAHGPPGELRVERARPSPFPLALVALVSFGIGFAGVRRAGDGNAAVKTAPAPQPSAANSDGPDEKADDSPAASQARIAAVRALAEKRRTLAEDAALYAALRKLDGRDFQIATAQFAAQFAPWNKRRNEIAAPPAEFVEAWMDRWLEVDSPGALKFLSAAKLLAVLGNDERRSDQNSEWSRAETAAYRALARREPDRTLAHLAAQPPAQQSDDTIETAFDEVARQDPAKARKFLESFSKIGNRVAAMHGVVQGTTAVDARAGFDLAAAEPAGRLREELLGTVLREAGKHGATTASALLDRIEEPQLRLKLAGAALNAMKMESNENPLPWIIEESAGSMERKSKDAPFPEFPPTEWISPVTEAVAGPHAAEAAEWAASFANDPKRVMFGNIAGRWASDDPPAFRKWVTEHLTTLDAASADKLGNVLFFRSPEVAEEMRVWAETLPPGRLRDRIQFQTGLSAATDGDVAKATTAYELVAAHDTSGALAWQVARKVAQTDGAGAAEWAMRLPAGPVREGAILAVATAWIRSDQQGVAEWIGTMPAGRQRDAVAGRFALMLSFADPKPAAEWVEQVADPDLRMDTASSVFSVWKGENPVAARAWLKGLTGIGEAWKKKTLRRR